MSSLRKLQTPATPSTITMSQNIAQEFSEPSTRSPSPSTDARLASLKSTRANRESAFWAGPLYLDYSPSVTRDSSPPYTRQTSVVDLEELKKEPYITVNSKSSPDSKKPYHVFSHRMKWAIVILIGVAGLFSGLSSNIYFPALDAIAHVSTAGSTMEIISCDPVPANPHQ